MPHYSALVCGYVSCIDGSYSLSRSNSHSLISDAATEACVSHLDEIKIKEGRIEEE